ncbi:hypothetical protein ACFQZX_12700 [Mucilaginibacter litoreus]|uniref:Uncharacterized protein n=1 Tax=Mucilaginibacter litoreus TaxID=1048221 RepID=A0ABW3AW11_9SPHI
MENNNGGFDRANDQGQNHDTQGNIENVDNETLKQEDSDLAQEIPTVTPDTENVEPNDTPEQTGEEQEENSSNKGQGPSGENL